MHTRTIIAVLGAALLAVLSACTPNSQTQNTQNFALPYPQARPASINLTLEYGELSVRSGGSGIAGLLTTNVSRWGGSVRIDEAQISVLQGGIGQGRVPAGTNTWAITLGADAPIQLTVQAGRANANLELGGLALDTLELTSEAGNLSLAFNTPVSQAGQRLNLTGGQSNITVERLLNADFAEINANLSGGRHVMGFDGRALQRDSSARIQLGSGQLTMRVPAEVRVRVIFRSAVGRVQRADPTAFIRIEDGVYETLAVRDSERADAPLLTVEVFSGGADLLLEGAS
jgi:hypothetical protein